MKYLLISLSILLFSFIFKGTDLSANEVPEKVTTTFNETFASAEDIEWKKTKHGVYEADFDILNIDYKAQISKSGHLTKYKHDIRLSKIPGDLATELNTTYSDYQIENIEKVVIGSTPYYQVELESSSAKKHKVFSATGKEATKIDFWN